MVDYRKTSTGHPSLTRGIVWCTECGRSQTVDPARCLRRGWPQCHGYTMTIDSPEERQALSSNRRGGMSGRPVWKDVTSYSRDGDRTPTSWRLSLSRDVIITIVSKHIYCPDEWVFHCRPWFDTFSLKLPGTPENRDEAQARAIALVREKISEIVSALREVN